MITLIFCDFTLYRNKGKFHLNLTFDNISKNVFISSFEKAILSIVAFKCFWQIADLIPVPFLKQHKIFRNA